MPPEKKLRRVLRPFTEFMVSLAWWQGYLGVPKEITEETMKPVFCSANIHLCEHAYNTLTCSQAPCVFLAVKGKWYVTGGSMKFLAMPALVIDTYGMGYAFKNIFSLLRVSAKRTAMHK